MPLVLLGRVWTDNEGRTFEGSLVKKEENYVVIKRSSDGKIFHVDNATLSLDDQKYIESYKRSYMSRTLDSARQLSIFKIGDSTPALSTLVIADIFGFLALLTLMSYIGKKLRFPDWSMFRSFLLSQHVSKTYALSVQDFE